ncbi:MAG: NUDIX domain-containing protein [Candidatus Pacebacteria bacterium]|nr:NUDIX domain-containing protein [Candidatus Paceibacterota bacterium]
MKENLKPNFCFTASGFLINEDKILLIKHKKLKAWLSPGGHLDKGELPHQAAEREFWEETGIRVEAIGYESDDFMALPFKSGLHWVCKENYERRKKNREPLKQWNKGCEQHFDLGYMMKPVAGLEYKKNVEETDGIAWFTFEEIEELNTFDDVKKSVEIAFNKIKNIGK